DALAKTTLEAVRGDVAAWPAERPALDRRHALRFVLRRDPANADAMAAVRELVPAGLPAGDPFPALQWLDFADATALTPVKLLDAKLEDFDGELSDDDRMAKQQLLVWRRDWRSDLMALQSDRLVLFSPLLQPGSLARSLATGEIVCDTLEAMFADLPRQRSDPRQMLVFIYPDQADYLAASKKLGFDASWTAGFYSDALNELVPKSRMFVPENDADFARVLPTMAHELTHQWLRDRCPAFMPDQVASRVGPRSYWIVEGFASFIEQFDFDLARRTARLGKGHLFYADLVASAEPSQLISWARLATLGRAGFAQGVASNRSLKVPSSMRLGASFQVRWRDAFYAQSAMLARYLYDAEDGKHRRALLDYVVAFYAGEVEKLDFEKAFGASPATIGAAVTDYARELLK
ncbi:MAG: hypothetical protein KDC98_02085, partial [Planctomycetes bacterium]|nr:hypothetical protein [Planctomycetota bacterium]